MEKEDCVQALSGQIFMGMVSSQFQARLDTVRLIENLVGACIRFVYFSREDELRSKVWSSRKAEQYTLSPNTNTVTGHEVLNSVKVNSVYGFHIIDNHRL